MAKVKTTRKTPVKKTKATTARKPVTKRSVAKEPDFFTFSPSIQTLYWIIIGILVIGLNIWVMNLNNKVQSIYDKIDENSIILMSEPVPTEKKDKQDDQKDHNN